jgi:hypothetical protein
LRDGKTIINGSRRLVGSSTHCSTLHIPYENNYNFITNDINVPKGDTNYQLILYNNSKDDLVTINYYSFIAEVAPKHADYFDVIQSYPPCNKSVTTVDSLKNVSFPLELIADDNKKIRLTFNSNLDATIDQTLILFNIERNNVSLTNGLQILYRDVTNTTNIIINNEHFSISLFDQIEKGKYVYTITLVNQGNLPIDINFYSFGIEH